MAGQLTIDTLKASSGVLATQNGMTGIAKAWVNYDGINKVIRNSFNVSSVTYNGTGDYTVNFTTAMPSADFCAQCSGNLNTAGSYGYYFNAPWNQAPTTTSIRLYCNIGTAAREAGYNYVSIFA